MSAVVEKCNECSGVGKRTFNGGANDDKPWWGYTTDCATCWGTGKVLAPSSAKRESMNNGEAVLAKRAAEQGEGQNG